MNKREDAQTNVFKFPLMFVATLAVIDWGEGLERESETYDTILLDDDRKRVSLKY